MISIKKVIAAFIIMFAMAIGLGYFWSFESYQPLKLAQEIINLKADVDNCERRWSRDFSKKHGLIEDE